MNKLTVEHDTDRLLDYWHDEQNAPRWYKEFFDRTPEAYLSFCERHTIYEVGGSALIFCEQMSPTIMQIHFSVLRGRCRGWRKLKMYIGFWFLRRKLFKEADIIFGMIFRLNYPVKRLIEKFGFRFNGLCLELPTEKGWKVEHCYAAHREYFVRRTRKSVVV